jgi:hypothetical protein
MNHEGVFLLVDFVPYLKFYAIYELYFIFILIILFYKLKLIVAISIVENFSLPTITAIVGNSEFCVQLLNKINFKTFN